MKKKQPTLIDLFSGAGGVTQGFKNLGFNVLAAVESDPIAAHSYHVNHPEVRTITDDIRRVDPKKLMKACDLKRGQLTVLSVCAPCQPFSRQTRMHGLETRTKLVLQMLRFVAVMRPQYAIMENVPGLSKGANKSVLDTLLKVLREKLKYSVVGPTVVDAVNYGVPQFRKRLILLCSRDGTSLQMPTKTHTAPHNAEKFSLTPWRTVGNAFTNLEALTAGQQSNSDPLHRARQHSALNLERLAHIPPNGGSRDSLPDHLQLACHKSIVDGYHDVYGRMDANRPANTLTTGCTNITRGRFAHPLEDRAITTREAARLQTFPDSYHFCGGYDQISSQIGNAVPVLLAEAIAAVLRPEPEELFSL